MKRPWCWERLRAGGEGDDRGWDGWMSSPTQWTWVLVDSGSWWWTGRPGMLRFMGSQRVGHDWATELTWTPQICPLPNSQNLWSYYLNGKRDFADVIKDLDREFGISTWTQCNHKCPLRVEKVSRRVWEIEDVMVLALKMKKRVMRECRQLLGTRKSGNGFSSSLQKGTQPADSLILVQGHAVCTSDLQDLRIINLYCFKPLNLWWCVTAAVIGNYLLWNFQHFWPGIIKIVLSLQKVIFHSA